MSRQQLVREKLEATPRPINPITHLKLNLRKTETKILSRTLIFSTSLSLVLSMASLQCVVDSTSLILVNLISP